MKLPKVYWWVVLAAVAVAVVVNLPPTNESAPPKQTQETQPTKAAAPANNPLVEQTQSGPTVTETPKPLLPAPQLINTSFPSNETFVTYMVGPLEGGGSTVTQILGLCKAKAYTEEGTEIMSGPNGTGQSLGPLGTPPPDGLTIKVISGDFDDSWFTPLCQRAADGGE